jgi:Fe-S-cluster-containing hydrogenase component 2
LGCIVKKYNITTDISDTKGERLIKSSQEFGNISRREFLKDSGLVIGGAVAGIGTANFVSSLEKSQALRIARAQGHIVQLAPIESACTGCGTCELVCAAVHGKAVGPSLRRIWVERDEINLVYKVLTCLQCDYPACYFACPARDKALRIDRKTKVRYIDSDNCQPDCDICIQACALDPPRIHFDRERNSPLMCDLCQDREQGPACVELCPAKCLELKV